MDTKPFIYYLIKRFFIFFNEWTFLFYYILHKLYINRHYKILSFVVIFGIYYTYINYLDSVQ